MRLIHLMDMDLRKRFLLELLEFLLIFLWLWKMLFSLQRFILLLLQNCLSKPFVLAGCCEGGQLMEGSFWVEASSFGRKLEFRSRCKPKCIFRWVLIVLINRNLDFFLLIRSDESHFIESICESCVSKWRLQGTCKQWDG